MSTSRVVLAVGLAVASAFPAVAQAPWYSNLSLSTDLLMMTRTRGDSPALTQQQSSVLPGDRTYSFDDLDGPGWRPGIAATLRYRLGGGAVAVRGFIVGQFGGDTSYLDANQISSISFTAPAYSFLPGTFTPRPTNTVTITGNSFSIGGMTAQYNSTLWGFEGSYEMPVYANGGLVVRAFAGPRYIQLRESLRTQSHFSDTTFSTANAFLTDTVDIGIRNNLIGGQIGAAVRYPVRQTVFVDAHVSGGLYANLVNRDRSFSGGQGLFVGSPFAAPFGYIDPTVSSTEFAQGIEAALGIAWRPMPAVTVSLGYQMLWLNNVSVAASHFESAANGNDRDTRANSSVLFHGFRIGASFGL